MSVRVKQSSAVKNHGDHPYNNIKKPKILVTELTQLLTQKDQGKQPLFPPQIV